MRPESPPVAGGEARETACESGSVPMRRRCNGSPVSAPMKRLVLGQMRSSAGVPTTPRADVWIVAEAKARHDHRLKTKGVVGALDRRSALPSGSSRAADRSGLRSLPLGTEAGSASVGAIRVPVRPAPATRVGHFRHTCAACFPGRAATALTAAARSRSLGGKGISQRAGGGVNAACWASAGAQVYGLWSVWRHRLRRRV